MVAGLYLGLELGGQYPVFDLAHELDGLLGEREGQNLWAVSRGKRKRRGNDADKHTVCGRMRARWAK